jgi:hypothetical protein
VDVHGINEASIHFGDFMRVSNWSIQLSKEMEYGPAYTLTAYMARLHHPNCAENDREIPHHVGTADIVEAMMNRFDSAKPTSNDVIISCIMMMRNNPVDQLLMYLLSLTNHASSLQWGIACAHRGNVSACEQIHARISIEQQQIKWTMVGACQGDMDLLIWLRKIIDFIGDRKAVSNTTDDNCIHNIISAVPSYYHDWYRQLLSPVKTDILSANPYLPKPPSSCAIQH